TRLAREAIHFAEVEARDLGIALRLELSPQPLDVEVDAIQLEQVILNLVRNGFEAMADGGAPRELRIETGARDAAAVELVVRDTGTGVSQAAAGPLLRPGLSPTPRRPGSWSRSSPPSATDSALVPTSAARSSKRPAGSSGPRRIRRAAPPPTWSCPPVREIAMPPDPQPIVFVVDDDRAMR